MEEIKDRQIKDRIAFLESENSRIEKERTRNTCEIILLENALD